jgi:hypothetical protein
MEVDQKELNIVVLVTALTSMYACMQACCLCSIERRVQIKTCNTQCVRARIPCILTAVTVTATVTMTVTVTVNVTTT